MPLTYTAIRNAKPGDKPYKLRDSGNLYLLVAPTGGKLWRMDYRFGGKRKLSAFGAYPEISLADARERRDEARKLLTNGIDPGAVKKAQKSAKHAQAANSFEVVAREWHETWKADKSSSHYNNVLIRLEKDVFPWIGDRSVAEIKAPEILTVLKRIESRGVLDTVQKVRGIISQAIRYAIATGRREEMDPCLSLRGALKPITHKHMAAITDPVKVGELLRAIDAFKGAHSVRAALTLAPLVFVRPGELRTARWADIHLEAAEWKYTASKTKTEHLVPLARQTVAILRDLQPVTGSGEYVFPNARPGGPMNNATINRALQALGYDTKTEITGHGFRAMARTLLAEELGFNPLIIEHQLAHRVPDVLGEAYNRTRYLRQRREMMQQWADYLDRLRTGTEVIPLRGMARE
jgi:integrase